MEMNALEFKTGRMKFPFVSFSLDYKEIKKNQNNVVSVTCY